MAEVVRQHCKALLEAGEFQACIDRADEALGAFATFHYDDDVSFKWATRFGQGRPSRPNRLPLTNYNLYYHGKRTGSFIIELPIISMKLGQLKDAWNNAVSATFRTGRFGVQVGIVPFDGDDPSRSRWELVEARRHVLLAARIRQEHDWKMPQELASVISDLNVDMAANIAAFDLQKDLRKKWLTAKQAELPRQTGEIIKLVSNGQAGFIAGDDGKDYYFKVASYKGPELVTRGLDGRVSYRKEPKS